MYCIGLRIKAKTYIWCWVTKGNLIGVEIARERRNSPIIEYMDLGEYKSGLTKMHQIRLAAAHDLAIIDIEECMIEAEFYIYPKRPKPRFYSVAE